MNIEDVLFKYCLSLKPCGKARVGAILTFKGNIVAFGYNQYKTHPLQARYGRNEKSIFLHAEISCIINSIRINPVSDLKRFTLLVGRAKRPTSVSPWRFGLARPCIGCQRAIAAFDIKETWYSTEKQIMEKML